MSAAPAAASRAVLGGRRFWHWRSSVVLTWSPALVVLSLLLTLANAGTIDRYWLAVSARATIGMLVAAPGLAALCAWEAGRWRRWPTARTALRPAAAQARPTLAAAAAVAVGTVTANVLMLAPAALGAPGRPHVGVLATAVAVILAHACAGYAAGLLLPRGVAVPLALGASFAWLAYPPAFEPFWVRNITGNLGTSCCDIDTALPAPALLAPLVVALAVCAGSGLVVAVGERRRRPVVVAGLALTLAGVVAARPMVDSLGPDPVLPRQVSMTCATTASVEVCSFPEHADLLPGATAVVADVSQRLAAAGVATPRQVTERSTNAPGVWSVRLDVRSEPALRELLAAQVLADVPPVCSRTQPWPAADRVPAVQSYLAVVAGVPVDMVSASLGEQDARTVAEVLSRPDADRARWVRETLAAVRSCRPAPEGA